MKEVRETKLVEQTTVKWFSDDGKEFDSELACKNYERGLKGETAKKAYERLVIAELEFPFQEWVGDLRVDLIKLKSYDDYRTVIDYFEYEMRHDMIDCKEPENYPCLRVAVYDEYWAEFAYENGIEGMLEQCEKIMTIVEKAISEVNQ